jgi:hypothetical protein
MIDFRKSQRGVSEIPRSSDKKQPSEVSKTQLRLPIEVSHQRNEKNEKREEWKSAFVKRLIGEWRRNLRNNKKDRPSKRTRDIAESRESMDRETLVRVKESRISTI